MSSLNKVQVIGNLCKDPEVRYSGDGKAIANLNVASSETWKDKSGEKQEKTEFHRVVVFGFSAEFAEKYLKKGQKVYVEGKLQTRKWTNKEGVDVYTTEIVVDGFKGQLLSLSKGEGVKPAMEQAPVESFDDDIPF